MFDLFFSSKLKKIYNLKINYFSLSRLTKLSSLYYCISHTCKDTDTFVPLLLKCLIGIDTQTFTQLSGQAFDLLKKGEVKIFRKEYKLMICSSSIYHNFKQRTIIEMQEIKEWILNGNAADVLKAIKDRF